MVFKTADVVKPEGGVGFGQKGLMMELQSLQEALKVEIQIHQKLVAQMKQDPQNAELKLQLHDLQAKITALSERQKKVVEQLRRDLLVKQESAEIKLQTQAQLPLQADGKTATLVSTPSQSSLPPAHLSAPQNSISVTPVIATKTLPLVLRAATPTTPIAMMPTPTIAMVTTLTNTPLPSLPNTDPQSSPIGLQASGKAAGQAAEPVRIVPKNTIVVMPKPTASVAPTTLQPILTPQPLQQPVLLAAKLSSALLPSSSGPVHQLHIFNPQPSPAITQPCTTNAQPCHSDAHPVSAVAQSCPVITQPCPNVLQATCPAITMTLSANISQISASGPQHSAVLPSILISPQPSKPHSAPSGPPGSDAPRTHAPHTEQSSDPRPDAPTPVAVDGVEPKTSSSSPTPRPATVQSAASVSPTSTTHTLIQTHNPPTLTPKRQDNPLKLAFMVSLGLVTHDYLEEIQSKRQERKRRTTANPVYSGAVFEPERKKSTVSYLNSPNQGCRKRGRPPKHSNAVDRGVGPLSLAGRHPVCTQSPLQPCVGGSSSPAHPQSLSSHPPPSSPAVTPSFLGDGDIHDDFCVVCRRSGQLLMCDACSRVYHLDCLVLPLRTVPRGMWICPSCQNQILKKDEPLEWPGTLAIVHSYISYKAEREQEKQKLEKWSSELRQEREELELQVKQLSDSLTICMESRNGVLAQQKEMEASIEKVKGLVRLIRGIQLPSLPQSGLFPTGMANGDLVTARTPHPDTIPDAEEKQRPNINEHAKNGSSPTYPLTVSCPSADHSVTSNASSSPENPNKNSVSGPEDPKDNAVSKNASTSRRSSTASNSSPLSNTHSQDATNASSNGTLEPEEGLEKSVNTNAIDDINKNNIGDISKNSIRDFRGSPEPTLQSVMPMAEVIQGVE